MGSLSIWHWMLFGAVALLLFGGKGKISDIMGDVAKGIKSFKKGMADDEEAPTTASSPRTIENRPRERRRRRQATSRRSAEPRGFRGALRGASCVRPMFDFDVGKLMVFGIVALAVIPPKDLPRVMRTVGKYVGQMRRMAAEFQGQFMDAIKEADLESVKKELDEINEAAKVDTSFDPAGLMRDNVDEAVERQARAGQSMTRPSPRPRPAVATRSCPSSRRTPPPEPATVEAPPARARRRLRARHDRRRHRGHQGAADGSSHRTARSG